MNHVKGYCYIPGVTDLTVKAYEEPPPADTRVGGYLITWGDPSTADTFGTFHTKATDLGPHLAAVARGERLLDVFLEHPEDPRAAQPIGRALVGFGPRGVVIAATIDQDTERGRFALREVAAGRLGWSSGGPENAVKCAAGGELLTRHINEASLVARPADRRCRAILTGPYFRARDLEDEMFATKPMTTTRPVCFGVVR